MNKHILFSLLFLMLTGLAKSQLQNVALNQPVTVSSEDNPPENTGGFAVDGIKDPSAIESRWVSAEGYPHFIEVDLGMSYEVSQVAFYTGYKKYNHPINDYEIQFWDGSGWSVIVNRNANNSSVVTENFDPVVTNKIRLDAKSGSGQRLMLYEFEVYGSPTNDNPGSGTGVGSGLWLDRGDTVYTSETTLVGIGTSNPDAPLTVRGRIHAEEVKIDLDVPAPDYVFEDSYKLMTLEDLEKYLKENKHLPFMPAGKLMESDGINIGEMQMNLLRTLEELILHQIRMQKELNALKQQNENLSRKLEQKGN